jgi:ubiquinone/menaquinone biosynthesis C-methylase UbiE
MNLLKRDSSTEELLDMPGVDKLVIARSLRDLNRLGKLLGWTHLAVREVAQVVAREHLHTFSVLDVGTGAANIPVALAGWARQQHLEAQLTTTDINEQMLAIARANAASFPEITIEQQNALALTYADQSFDVVLCQGVLHHFSPDEARVLLRELARVARQAVIVIDLRRSLPLYLGGWLLLHTLVRNPVTRHDGLASIRRAYTLKELRALAAQADLPAAAIHTTFHFRQTLHWTRRARSLQV